MIHPNEMVCIPREDFEEIKKQERFRGYAAGQLNPATGKTAELQAERDRFREYAAAECRMVEDILSALNCPRTSPVLDVIKALKADAELGRLVRAMPDNGVLERRGNRWYANTVYYADTPEEALRATIAPGLIETERLRDMSLNEILQDGAKMRESEYK